MNIQNRVRGANQVLGVTSNNETLQAQLEATLTSLGNTTTEINVLIDEISVDVDNGDEVDPDKWAELKEKIAKLDEAFPDGEQLPAEPEGEGGEIDNELPSQPATPDNTLPSQPATPDNTLPSQPATPDNTLPGQPVKPGTLPGETPQPKK